jgi:hypothetical protein
MAVKININTTRVEAKVMSAWEKGLPLLSSEILNDCNQYCKEDTGMLIASSFVHSRLDEGKLIWKTPYARRQYWEIQTAYKTVNPNATWKWCEEAKRRHVDRWQKQAQRLLEMNL